MPSLFELETPKRAALYIRVSTDEQVEHGNGMQIQEEALRKYVDSQWFSLDDTQYIYRDEWFSGGNTERPALQRLYEDARHDAFDVVIVWKVDRFSRKMLHILEGIDYLDHHQVGFISATQPFDTTQPFGKAMLQMVGVIAELERDLIKERTQSGVLASMKKWKWGRWRPCYGYVTNSEGFLEIEPTEAEVVQKIFCWVEKEKLSYAGVVNRLNELGIPPRTKTSAVSSAYSKRSKHGRWIACQVHKILRNEVYTGTLIQNRYMKDKRSGSRVERPESEWVTTPCPVIIEPSLFQAVQEQIASNKRNARRNQKPNRNYLLGGLLECGHSRYRYTGYVSAKGTKNYRISAGKMKGYLGLQRSISARIIEWSVWDRIEGILKNPKALMQELQKTNGLKKRLEHINAQIQHQKECIESKRLHNHTLLTTMSDTDRSTTEQVKKIILENNLKIKEAEMELGQLRKQKRSLASPKEITQALQKQAHHLIKHLDLLNEKAKEQICQQLIQKVIIKDEQAEIFLRVPKTPRSEWWHAPKWAKKKVSTSKLNMKTHQKPHINAEYEVHHLSFDLGEKPNSDYHLISLPVKLERPVLQKRKKTLEVNGSKN